MHKKLKITLESCLVYASVSSEVQADEQKSPVFHARKMLKGIARLQQLAIRNPFRHWSCSSSPLRTSVTTAPTRSQWSETCRSVEKLGLDVWGTWDPSCTWEDHPDLQSRRRAFYEISRYARMLDSIEDTLRFKSFHEEYPKQTQIEPKERSPKVTDKNHFPSFSSINGKDGPSWTSSRCTHWVAMSQWTTGGLAPDFWIASLGPFFLDHDREKLKRFSQEGSSAWSAFVWELNICS